mmetsp:Transcript_2350/g.9208  ORF Transcript_2350/g.9208 Transcript_2350/m.9208 type:complete len:336 (-) Transcript_2350:467-1474(-)
MAPVTAAQTVPSSASPCPARSARASTPPPPLHAAPAPPPASERLGSKRHLGNVLQRRVPAQLAREHGCHAVQHHCKRLLADRHHHVHREAGVPVLAQILRAGERRRGRHAAAAHPRLRRHLDHLGAHEVCHEVGSFQRLEVALPPLLDVEHSAAPRHRRLHHALNGRLGAVRGPKRRQASLRHLRHGLGQRRVGGPVLPQQRRHGRAVLQVELPLLGVARVELHAHFQLRSDGSAGHAEQLDCGDETAAHGVEGVAPQGGGLLLGSLGGAAPRVVPRGHPPVPLGAGPLGRRLGLLAGRPQLESIALGVGGRGFGGVVVVVGLLPAAVRPAVLLD